jgi:hypothetical protein
MTATKSYTELLKDLTAKKEDFLKAIQPFCHLPVKMYFNLKEEHDGEEFILSLETTDALSGFPRRSFRMFDPNVGDLVVSLRHRAGDWFDLIVAKPDSTSGKIKSVNSIFSITYWSLKGVANDKHNEFYLSCKSGYEGGITEGKETQVIRKLICQKNFVDKMLTAMYAAKV